MPKRVLVVDDDPAQRRILEETIKRFGYSVATADSGNRALDALKADNTGEICLVLLDLVMPGTDGLAVLSAMRTLPRQPPARMTTATTVNPIQIDNDSGAASPMPVELMYQPTTPAATAPTSPALGTHTSRHHRDRQPTAAANAAAAITWTVHGSQPWINDTS